MIRPDQSTRERGRAVGRRRWPLTGRALLVAAALLALPASASAATITGTAFEDFNDDGARNSSPMVDAGVGGITVKGYRADGTEVASTTTAANGTYTLNVPDGIGEVRVEFTDLPAGYQPARHGASSGTTVQFVNGSASNVDVGVLQPFSYCQNNPQLAVACMQYGGHTGEFSGAAAIRIVPDSTPEDAVPDQLGAGGTLPGEVAGATFAQVGTVFGVVQPQGSNFLYSSSYTKRHADWGPGGPGAIYRTNVSQADAGTPNASVFFDVNSLSGTPAGSAPRGTNGWIRDTDAWDAVGNSGLGNIVTNDTGTALFTVALATGELIRIPVPGDGSSPPASSVDAYDIPSPCTPAGDARPMGVGWHNGLLYVGGVCSMASAGNPPPQPGDGLSVYVYTFDPAGGTFSATPVLDSPLDADRLCTYRAVPWPTDGCFGSADWHPWTSSTAVADLGSYPQPMLSDIEFDGDDLVLGIRDRFADQIGAYAQQPDSTDAENGAGAGYTLRACVSGAGYQLESNASCGGVTHTGGQVANWGPGDGLFYWDQRYGYDEGDPVNTGIHDYTGIGGVLSIPGYPEIRQTAMDVVDDCPPQHAGNAAIGCDYVPRGPFNAAGVLYMNHDDGSRAKGYDLYVRDPDVNNGTFAKANGLGDLEALCEAAPIEIGNYVWLDPDRDGVQDPGETKLEGVKVELLDAGGSVVATTTTSASGQYFFNESNVPGAIQPNTAYTVRIPLDQQVLAAYLPTGADTSAQLRDSDGITEARYVVDRLTTGAAGHNDHTHDFGFFARRSEFTFTKTSSRQRVRVGDQLTYTVTAENKGPDAALPGWVVRDPVPAEFDVVRVTPDAGATCNVDGRDVRCTLAGMAVGQKVEVKIRVKAVEAGGARNVAYLDPPPGEPCCAPPPTPPPTVTVVKPKLQLSKAVNRKTVRAGGQLTYRLRVRNPSNASLRRVRVCDDLPAGLTFVASKPKAKVRKGLHCWTVKRLRPGQSKRFRITARALQGISPGRKVNRATATSPDARTARSKRAVRVRAGQRIAGGVTG